MGDELNIVVGIQGETANLALEGNLSTISTPYLKEEVAKLGEGVSQIVIDIAQLDYASEEGFEYLFELDAQLKERGGKLVLVHPNEFMADMIDDLGVAEKVQIEA